MSEATFESIKLNTTLPDLRLGQSKIPFRFDIWFRHRISHTPNIMHWLWKLLSIYIFHYTSCIDWLGIYTTNEVKFDTIISDVALNRSQIVDMWNSTFEPGLTEKSKEIRETWPWAEMHLLLILSHLFFTVVRNAIIADPGLNFNPRSCFCLSEVYSLAVLILASHLEVTRTWSDRQKE